MIGGRVAARLVALGLCAAFAAVGCRAGDKHNGTALVVVVTSELAPPEIDRIDIAVGAGAPRSFSIGTTGDLPVRLGLVPRGDPGFSIEVTASALRAGTVVVTQTVEVGFVRDEQKQFTMHLTRACARPAPCPDASETCTLGGQCRARNQVVELLPYPDDGRDGGAGADGPSPSERPPGVDGAGPDVRGDVTPEVRPDIPPDVPPITGTWTTMPAPNPMATLTCVWPVGPNLVYAVGYVGAAGVAYVWNGTMWNPVMLPAGTPTLTGVWAASATEVWAVGYNGTILRRMGNVFVADPRVTNEVLAGIWGFGANRVYAVGGAGTVIRYDGTTWMATTSGIVTTLTSVGGAAPDVVVAVGTGGMIYRLVTNGWQRQNHGLTSRTLFSVWANSAADVWAVGDGTALHFDGATWSQHSGAPDTALSVWGTAPNDMWSVGSRPPIPMIGLVSHWNGFVWQPVTSPAVGGLQSVRGLPSGDVWEVGVNGQTLRVRRH